MKKFMLFSFCLVVVLSCTIISGCNKNLDGSSYKLLTPITIEIDFKNLSNEKRVQITNELNLSEDATDEQILYEANQVYNNLINSNANEIAILFENKKIKLKINPVYNFNKNEEYYYKCSFNKISLYYDEQLTQKVEIENTANVQLEIHDKTIKQTIQEEYVKFVFEYRQV